MLGRKIGLARSAVYGARAYLDERGYDLSFDQHDWIGLVETLAHLPEYSWLERYARPERIVLRLNNLPHKIELVKDGHGVAPLLCFLAEREPTPIRPTEPNPQFDTDIWLLSHPDLRQVARIRVFGDFIASHAKTDPPVAGRAVATFTSRLRPTSAGRSVTAKTSPALAGPCARRFG